MVHEMVEVPANGSTNDVVTVQLDDSTMIAKRTHSDFLQVGDLSQTNMPQKSVWFYKDEMEQKGKGIGGLNGRAFV